MTSLFLLTNELRQSLDDAFDSETGEALPAFEECRALWGSKARDVAAYVLNLESDADQCKQAIARIKKAQQAYENKSAHIRAYLAQNMAASGITELKANDGSFCAKLSIGRDESVDVFDEAQIPADYMVVKVTETPDKALIKCALRDGFDVPGARIIKADRLTIK